MERNAKAYSFLISALITTFSFILMVAIVMYMFSNALQIAHNSENKTIALNLAQTKIEELKTEIESMPEKELAAIVEESQKSRENSEIVWNEKNKEFVVEYVLSGERYTKGILVNIDLEILGQTMNNEPESLVELSSAVYTN